MEDKRLLGLEPIDKILVAKFMSVNNTANKTFEEADSFESAAILNTNEAMWTEMNNCATLNTSPLVASDPKNNMRLLNDIWSEARHRRVLIKDVYFTMYFTQSTGNAEEQITPEMVQQTLLTSLNTVNSAYPQPMFEKSPTASFQPNWFNPIIYANDKQIFGGLSTTIAATAGNAAGKQDLSIGLDLPYKCELNVLIDKFTALNVRASCYNRIVINNTTYYQRYPLSCAITLAILES